MSQKIIGISAYYHDSAAALMIDGKIVCAAQQERFSRKKHDAAFPKEALLFCLKEAGLTLKEIDVVCFYDKPLIKFERLLETYLSCAPKGFRSFLSAMPVWLKEKLFLKETLRRELLSLSDLPRSLLPQLLFTEHHQSHASSAFFPSPFEKAAVLCLDGVGEWVTTSAWLGDKNKLTPCFEIQFPHSLGLLYSAFTYYCGFKVNSGEYKLMGLAPYGKPCYVDLIYKHLIHLNEDGSFRLNMRYFNYLTGLTMTNKRFDQIFGGPVRRPESEITQRHMNLAASIQVVIEQVVIRMARYIQKKLDVNYLCLAGGVALNCVANGKLLKAGIFKQIWVQPASGDAGGAIGACYSTWHEYFGKNRLTDGQTDCMQGAYLGPSFSNQKIREILNNLNAQYEQFDEPILIEKVATFLAEGHVVGWFQGKMEFGPRALGARSILGDPRNKKMQSVMNLKIKYRESFRPFAPAVKLEKVSNWFDFNDQSPYMLMVSNICEDKKINLTSEQNDLFGIEKLNISRSILPAITHVDYSARIQTVGSKLNQRFWKLLDVFEKITGVPVLINTSFNVRGEPIVCTPEEAYQCFMSTHMDYLILENIILKKTDQLDQNNVGHFDQSFDRD